MSEPIRAMLRKAHRWLGLLLALPLLIQAATGLILAMTPPFEAMRMPSPRSVSAPPHKIGAIVAAAQSEEAHGLIPSRYQAGATDRDTATVDFVRPGERAAETRVFVDPGSLEVLDWRSRPDEFYAWAHGLHEFLLMPGPLGRGIIGWVGVGLLVLGLTGIPIWWPRRGGWQAAFSVDVSARGYRFQRALHGAAGGWLVALLLLQSLSGVSMAFPNVANAILGVAAGRPPNVAPRPARIADVDSLADAARAAVPGAVLTSLRFPTQAGRPAIATLLAEGAPPVIVFLDPYGGQVIAKRDPRAAGPGASVLAWLRALHSGDALGSAWRGVICLSGVGLALLPITGLIMWLSRRRRHPSRRSAWQGASE